MVEDRVRRFYEQEATIYDEVRFKKHHGKYSDLVQRSLVLDLIGECKDKFILEIGSGTGRFTRELVKKGAHVFCADLSRKMHERSRENLGCNDVEYFVMSGSKLGFADGSFDGCLAVEVMSHVKNVSVVLEEVQRVLKRGGFFIANFPNMSGVYFPIGLVVNLFQRSLQAPVYSRWYSIRGIIRSIKTAGLNPIQIIGRMVFPKTCSTELFILLREIDQKMLNSNFFNYICGDLFVKSCKL